MTTSSKPAPPAPIPGRPTEPPGPESVTVTRCSDTEFELFKQGINARLTRTPDNASHPWLLSLFDPGEADDKRALLDSQPFPSFEAAVLGFFHFD